MRFITRDIQEIINAVCEDYENRFELGEYTLEDVERMAHCERCPLADLCGENEYYFGCQVWEDYMGEDL